jgi:ABC-type transport system involved in multi-copper enzyme maturation permease subunit
MAKRDSRRWSKLYRFYAVVKYELLWHIRKKKVLGILVLVFSLAILSLVLPVVLSSVFDRPLNSDPNHVINQGIFLGELGFFLLAIVTAMNSVSGEFESGTIIPLLTKPISRTTVFLGKLFSIFVILLATYVSLFFFLGIGGVIVYGPQNNLHLLPITIIGSLFSTFVWVSIVLAIGSVSKSSLIAALGAFGVWLGLGLGVGISSVFSGETWILNYIPGSGARGYISLGEGSLPTSGPLIQTGTGSISENLVKLILNPETIVNFVNYDLSGGTPTILNVYSETLSFVALRSLIVATIYICVFFFIAWFALRKSEVYD